MSSVDRVLSELKPILQELQKENTTIKISVDKEAGLIKIYTEASDYIKQASSGLEETLELAYTTAEHHPYWLMLYNSTGICKTLLDKWESELSADELSEISWRCEEIKMAVERIGR
ncbi:MAG TPA: hypothetical protein VGE82_00555 [Nitrososphaera sp.]|jgi:hypothetical protein